MEKIMDRELERLAREDRQDKLTRLNSDNARLKLALQDAKADAAVNAGDLRDAKECLSIANDGLPMDMTLWAILKRQRDSAVAALRDVCDANTAFTLPPRTAAETRLSDALSAARTLLKELEPESEGTDA